MHNPYYPYDAERIFYILSQNKTKNKNQTTVVLLLDVRHFSKGREPQIQENIYIMYAC